MAGEEAAQPLVFLLLYLLMKRRKDRDRAEEHRRRDAHRRVTHRLFFLQRQRRMLMMLTACSAQLSSSYRSRTWTNTASTDWWERVAMREFAPHDWLDKFRMSRDTFFYLCGKLRLRLARQDTHFRQALPVEKRVAVALWRLATNVEYRTISALFGVGRSTVCKCVRDVCHAIVGVLRPIYLRWPGEQELEDGARLFHRLWGFPHCVGAVDSLHIAINAPSSNAASYWNGADWLSVVLQGAVDGLGRFWDVCAGFPGSTDDAAILQNSALWAAASEGGLSLRPPRPFMGRSLSYVLLGDEAYPLRSWLLKRYPESPELTLARRVFNRQLNRAHGAVDGAFLRLKARWQCLNKRNDCSLDLVPTMILACCVLHNVCEVHGDTFVEEWLEVASETKCPQPSGSVPASADDPAAEEVRTLFCDYFQQERG